MSDSWSTVVYLFLRDKLREANRVLDDDTKINGNFGGRLDFGSDKTER